MNKMNNNANLTSIRRHLCQEAEDSWCAPEVRQGAAIAASYCTSWQEIEDEVQRLDQLDREGVASGHTLTNEAAQTHKWLVWALRSQ